MNKTVKMIMDNKVLSAGLILAGVFLGYMVVSAYSNTSLSKQTSDSFQEQTYGPLGYGRANTQGKMNGQGKNINSDNGQGMQNGGLTKQNCLADGCLLVEDADYPVEELDAQTIEYLQLALEDERKALATYEATMEKFGIVRPFVNIARAEEQHISMLKALFDKYGVAIPEDATEVGTLPATLQEVCAIGVQAEIDNDQLYQDMIPNIQQEDIRTVFTSLARASKEMHLPAFERCAK